ncbi:acetyl-CoA carboxylase biotin carboxylase subunit [Simiduia curdlanivorans]|uniref:Acetyl/propionyl/methylcrotonyl-CoA carboxylase subunit alpha n=1 Tax=Simiduia curdlanivorans TaxID=1492769 RepID=A0ABV8V7Y6_9GAMM|nr:acetyl-CoA carboxylase biotin carboxylase subunit [Simiduia curdlanivorans]MDN3639651.1 acetyl-CoA carboxylase biotin carboxylase subunit [Simiduia curdlanivorans]
MHNKKISRLLIANRGEIACRIIRTARQLGIKTIAVFSEADADALHVQQADESYCIGPAAATQSYLNIDALIEAAQQTRADAVHPGYGFLSENAAFAQALADNNIIFIGPSAEAIALMGDKRRAKTAMIEAGIPTLAGYSGDNQNLDHLVQQANTMGFPIMVKAAAGGGGRGMRLVTHADQLSAAINSARSEAQNAFGNGELLLERALTKPRHVEVQIFADQLGNTVYLGERDCSIQRRHQKVVEEAPAPGIDEKTRIALGSAALLAAQSCNYVGAGTVEFLLDSDGRFYFLEMNTRLQVEHPVTEAVFGVDLIAWQIAVAEGKPLPKTQTELTPNGHALEVRLYAENPSQNFLPQTGKVARWQSHLQPYTRIDHMLFDGYLVSNWYDPMLAKIIAWGETREQALAHLIEQIDHTTLLGVGHNLGYLRTIVDHPAFRAEQVHTGFLAEHGLNELFQPQEINQALVAASLLDFLASNHNPTIFTALSHLSHAQQKQWQINDCIFNCRLDAKRWKDGALRLDIAKAGAQAEQFSVTHITLTETQLRFHINNEKANADYCSVVLKNRGHYFLQLGGNPFTASLVDPLATSLGSSANSQCCAPMDGMVVELLVENGTQVESGDTLLILEAMKMEMPIKAQESGFVRFACAQGEQVKQGFQLASIKPSHKEAS